MKFTEEEKKILEKINSGLLDGIVGDFLPTGRGSSVWMTIKNGIPQQLKQGPNKKFFNGKENEIIEGTLHTLQKWITDEEKIQFIRRYGWLMKDTAAQVYSAKFKTAK